MKVYILTSNLGNNSQDDYSILGVYGTLKGAMEEVKEIVDGLTDEQPTWLPANAYGVRTEHDEFIIHFKEVQQEAA